MFSFNEMVGSFISLSKSESKELLTKWSQAYYDGEPIVDDSVFDACLIIYKNKFVESFDVTAFGYDPRKRNPDRVYKHLTNTHIGSLDKTRSTDPGFNSILPNASVIVVTPKLDGGSVVAYYLNGVLIRIISRGNGVEGVDVTENLRHTVPVVINEYGFVAIRGEVVMSWSGYESLNYSDDGHPRNKAVGLSQSIYADPKETELLIFIAYSVLDVNFSKITQLNFLQMNGFKTPSSLVLERDDFFNLVNKDPLFQADEVAHLFKTGSNDELIPFDGLVLTDDNNPSKSIAYKFPDETVTTTVNDIVWQFSNTGKYVPVAVVDTVNLSGANISRVTLNNVTWLEERGIGVGAKVKLVRANMVIPKIVDVIQKSDVHNVPTHCPMCHFILERKGVNLYCLNNSCFRKDKVIIYNLFAKYAPKHLGSTMLESFIEKHKLYTLFTVKTMLYSDSLDSILRLNHTDHEYKLLTETIVRIKSSKKTVKDILDIVGCPNLGDVGKTKLQYTIDANTFINILKTKDFSGLNLYAKQVLNSLALSNLLDNFESVCSVAEFFDYYIVDNKIKFAEKKQPIGVTWAMTGSLKYFKSRDDLGSVLEAEGIFWDGPSKKTTFFLCNNPSSSSKYQKAVSLGLTIVNEDEFINKLYSEYGVDLRKYNGSV